MFTLFTADYTGYCEFRSNLGFDQFEELENLYWDEEVDEEAFEAACFALGAKADWLPLIAEWFEED